MVFPIRIVLTGGPCAGKSQALPFIKALLLEKGFHPVLVPEAASLVFGAAGRPSYDDKPRLMEFQKAIILVQKQIEDLFLSKLCAPNTVLISDRGILDNKAFVYPEDWSLLLSDLNLTEAEIGLKRYDAVIHLVTAADGAPAHYKLEGVRNESLEKAIKQDQRLQHLYAGHPCRYVIDNSTDFEGKLARVQQAVEAVIRLET